MKTKTDPTMFSNDFDLFVWLRIMDPQERSGETCPGIFKQLLEKTVASVYRAYRGRLLVLHRCLY